MDLVGVAACPVAACGPYTRGITGAWEACARNRA